MATTTLAFKAVRAFWVCLSATVLFSLTVCGQLSRPIALDSQVDVSSNKFLQRRADQDDRNIAADDEILVSGQCDANLALKWMTEVSSSVYATPVIHDLFSDGHKDIIVPSFVHYLEVLDGINGGKATEDGWPAFHKSTIHASPLPFDFDFDNVQDILVATYDGEILIFKDTGEQLPEKLVVPRLRVHRDWFVGLAEDFIDHSHPDVGTAEDEEPVESLEVSVEDSSSERTGRRLLEVSNLPNAEAKVFQNTSTQHRVIQQQTAENKGSISDDAAATFSELFGDEQAGQNDRQASQQGSNEQHDIIAEMAGANEVSWDQLPMDADGIGHDRYNEHYGDYHVEPSWKTLHDQAWSDETYFAAPHKPQNGFVMIDSHIMCTPAIGDIDGDRNEELVVAASYFFDREYYDVPEHKKELGKDIDTAKYIACGIVVFDLRTRQIKWTQHLDLSTDHTQFRAYAYSSPTLADIDLDGKLEIIVGTSMGFLYVLDHKGNNREGWPLQMGEIQAQVAVADLRGGQSLVIVAADTRGNVAAFDADGNELWEQHLGTLIAQAPTFADVDGDGALEVLLGSTSGGIYVLSGLSGQTAENFPVYSQGRIMAPILPTRIRPGSSIQLIAPSYDGHLYVIDGVSGCTDVVDIGETAYAMVLADDLDGNGMLDLLLATMNGNLYAFQSSAPADPLATWTSQVLGNNGFTSRLGWLSVAATPATRQPRDVRGKELSVRFDIRDPRPQRENATLGPYNVSVFLQGVGRQEMNAGPEPVIGVIGHYTTPGSYILEVPCPRTRSTATIHIELHDGLGQMASDDFSLSFHMHFHRLLKWILAGPFTLACLMILAQNAEGLGLSLPSSQ